MCQGDLDNKHILWNMGPIKLIKLQNLSVDISSAT